MKFFKRCLESYPLFLLLVIDLGKMSTNMELKLNNLSKQSDNKFGYHSASSNNITIETLKEGDTSVIYGVEAGSADISISNSMLTNKIIKLFKCSIDVMYRLQTVVL